MLSYQFLHGLCFELGFELRFFIERNITPDLSIKVQHILDISTSFYRNF